MLKFDFNNMMKKYIGADGLTEQDLAAVAPEAEAAFGKLGLSAARADREALAVLGALEEDTVKRIARLGRGKERE